mmetsp:Transcript_60800/g.131916  ORF Transcript_60800/g.131916 Transcript_60800/m.131916 type:complete len:493 (-) Transcript_60800:65-1543(-)
MPKPSSEATALIGAEAEGDSDDGVSPRYFLNSSTDDTPLVRASHKLCRGVAQHEYFAELHETGAPPPGSIRIPSAGLSRRRAPRETRDPLMTMQDGLPVLFFEPGSSSFEQRIVKVDDRLVFLYVLPHKASEFIAKEDNRGYPMVTRLKDIVATYSHDDAMRICDLFELDRQKHHLSRETLVVVHFGQMYKEVPRPDKTFIFMAPPHEHLKYCVDVCVSKASHNESFSVVRAKLGVEEMSLLDAEPEQLNTKKDGIKRGSEIRRLVSVRLRDIRAISNKYGKAFDMEITHCPDHGGTEWHIRKFLYQVPATMTTASCAVEVRKIGQKMSGQDLQVLDAARLELILRDMVLLRSWATSLAKPDAFAQGIQVYLEDRDILRSFVSHSQALGMVVREVGAPLTQRGKTAGANVERSALIATSVAMGHLLSLEQEYADVARRGWKLGVLEEAIPCMTLAGEEVLETNEVEPLPSLFNGIRQSASTMQASAAPSTRI